jgi:hypothetical protein
MKESSTDRAALKVAIDVDVKAVLEFIQDNVPANKLIAVSERLPEFARLLWGHFPQESCNVLRLELEKSPKTDSENQSQPSAI